MVKQRSNGNFSVEQTPSRFSRNIEAKAFRMRTEYAWKKEHLLLVFEYCRKNMIAVIGCEAWVVRSVKDSNSDEPTEPIHNLDPVRNKKVSLLGRTSSHLIFGDFPLRNGTRVLFTFTTLPKHNDGTWLEYVESTIKETEAEIEEGNLEKDIIPEYSNSVYNNLRFKTEDGTSF